MNHRKRGGVHPKTPMKWGKTDEVKEVKGKTRFFIEKSTPRQKDDRILPQVPKKLVTSYSESCSKIR